MKTEGAVRQDLILEAAIRRFSHFGINKTTLTEVAEDLAMSKQTLHYYFSDKQSLVAAVEKKVTGEYIDALAGVMNDAPSVAGALQKLIDVKKEFFEKYFLLAVQARSAEAQAGQKAVAVSKQQLMEKERALLVGLMQKGMATGELRSLDATQTACLLLDTMTAFAHCLHDKGLPELKDFEEIQQKQRAVMHLFYEGLKK